MSKFPIEKVMKSIAKIKKRKTKDAMYKLASYCVDLETRLAIVEDTLCQATMMMGEINGMLKEGVDKIEASIENTKNTMFEYHFTDEVYAHIGTLSKFERVDSNPYVGTMDKDLFAKAYKVVNKDTNCVVKIAGETVNEQ